MTGEVFGLDLARPILDAIAHPVIITGSDARIAYWNPAAVSAYGYTADEAIGQEVPVLLGEPDDPVEEQAIKSLAQGQPWTGELISRTKFGESRVMLVTLTPMLDQIAVIATAVDVTTAVADRRRLAEALAIVEQQSAQLRHQALHDSLTGLPNRVLLLDRAEQMLSRARRDRSRVAALFLDLDDFKSVNDTFGHAAGDDLLRGVATRLVTEMRASDTLGRMGGDEFVYLTEGPSLGSSPEIVAQRLLEVLRKPIAIGVEPTRKMAKIITASIGVAEGVRPTAESLLHDADLAMYRAKASGKNCYAVFEGQNPAS